MNRFFQVLLIVSAVGLSWLGMMAVHELGHVLHLALTGGTVDYVVLHPLAISYTHPGNNPHPLVVAWGGAIWGCAIPVVAFIVARRFAPRWAYLPAFFAGFCLLANGAYLAGDAFMQGGDGRELVAYGSSPWLLVILGLATAAAGLYLWNGLGPCFGLGPARGKVDRRVAIGTLIALAATVLLEAVVSLFPSSR
jgi:hypothetical protein